MRWGNPWRWRALDPPATLPLAARPPACLQTLGRLGVQWDKKTKAMRLPKDLYANLLSVGNISIDMGGQQQAAAANGGDGTVRLGYDAASARDWWKNFVFGKTFVERRSMLTMYRWVAAAAAGCVSAGCLIVGMGWLAGPACLLALRVCGALRTWALESGGASAKSAQPVSRPPPSFLCVRVCRTFYRVWAFLILEFHLMAVLLWGWTDGKLNWYALCSVSLDHALLSLLEQVAGAWTQRSPGEAGWAAAAAAAGDACGCRETGAGWWAGLCGGAGS